MLDPDYLVRVLEGGFATDLDILMSRCNEIFVLHAMGERDIVVVVDVYKTMPAVARSVMSVLDHYGIRFFQRSARVFDLPGAHLTILDGSSFDTEPLPNRFGLIDLRYHRYGTLPDDFTKQHHQSCPLTQAQ